MLVEVASALSYLITTLVAIHLADVFLRNGAKGLFRSVGSFVALLPGVDYLIKNFIKKEVNSFVAQSFNKEPVEKKLISIPEKGIPTEDLKKEIENLKSGNNLVEDGRLFAYVYTAEGPRLELQKEAFKMFTNLSLTDVNEDHVSIVQTYLEAFMHDNALNPFVFPYLRKFENEVVAMTASMLHGDGHVVGSVTSGGTESILMAMKTYRDQARNTKPSITNPNVIAPITIHPAFEKAAHYFNLTIKHVPVNQTTFVCDLGEYEEAIDSNTILLLASAPSYPQAILDPVQAISRVALRHKLPFHVDACFGGFMLPWVEKLGFEIPRWDFRLPGVTSITADLHKYGFATKGASVVCYRDSSIRKFQFFAYSGWSGGLFASPTMAGTRPGGHLAGAWVALRAMGQDGYVDMAKKLMDVATKMKKGINAIEGLEVLGNPLMTAFGFGSNDKKISIFAVADAMDKKDVVPSPSGLSILSDNLNALLQWNPVVINTSSDDVNNSKEVTYTVKYRAMDINDTGWSWKTMPNCVHIKQTRCMLTKLYPFERNHLVVQSDVANMSHGFSTVEYAPNLEEKLHAPNFTVTVNGSYVIIEIPDPPRAFWSTALLSDVLRDDDLQYEVQYWIKEKGEVTAQTTIRSADLSIIHIPVKKCVNETVCLRMKLQSEIEFLSAGYSNTVCSTGERNPKVHPTNHTALFASVGLFGLLLSCVVIKALLLAWKRCVKFMNPKGDRAIPEGLASTLKDCPHLNKYPSVVDVEHVTEFRPDASSDEPNDDAINENVQLNLKSSVTVEDNGLVDSNNHLSNNNDYVVVCAPGSETSSLVNDITDYVALPRTPSLPKITVSSKFMQHQNLKGISDYVVQVPSSPDSGLDMQSFF